MPEKPDPKASNLDVKLEVPLDASASENFKPDRHDRRLKPKAGSAGQ